MKLIRQKKLETGQGLSERKTRNKLEEGGRIEREIFAGQKRKKVEEVENEQSRYYQNRVARG